MLILRRGYNSEVSPTIVKPVAVDVIYYAGENKNINLGGGRMSNFWQHAIDNWKTTLSGFLSFALGTLGVVNTYLVVGDAAAGNGIHVSTKVVTGIALATALGKFWVGWLQKDAGQTLAIPADGGPAKEVPAHGIPDDPNATPIVKP